MKTNILLALIGLTLCTACGSNSEKSNRSNEAVEASNVRSVELADSNGNFTEHAAPVCNTLPECQQLKENVDARIQELQAGLAPQFGDIVRHADGSINYMSQSVAISYCAGKGMHLPSARELAQLATSMGAAGFSETPKKGYQAVQAWNADGEDDVFYFSSVGYKSPAGDLGNNWFWSSSRYSVNPQRSYNLYGKGGDLILNERYFNYFAVRCVVGR